MMLSYNQPITFSRFLSPLHPCVWRLIKKRKIPAKGSKYPFSHPTPNSLVVTSQHDIHLKRMVSSRLIRILLLWDSYQWRNRMRGLSRVKTLCSQLWSARGHSGCRHGSNEQWFSKESDLACTGCVNSKSGISVDNTSQTTVPVRHITVLFVLFGEKKRIT